MINFLVAHPWLGSMIVSAATFIFNNVITALVSSLPAPTKDSTVKYVYWFKVANTIVGNFQRAKSTRIEDSPNFQAAVEAYIANLEAQQARIAGVSNATKS